MMITTTKSSKKIKRKIPQKKAHWKKLKKEKDLFLVKKYLQWNLKRTRSNLDQPTKQSLVKALVNQKTGMNKNKTKQLKNSLTIKVDNQALGYVEDLYRLLLKVEMLAMEVQVKALIQDDLSWTW